MPRGADGPRLGAGRQRHGTTGGDRRLAGRREPLGGRGWPRRPLVSMKVSPPPEGFPPRYRQALRLDLDQPPRGPRPQHEPRASTSYPAECDDSEPVNTAMGEAITSLRTQDRRPASRRPERRARRRAHSPGASRTPCRWGRSMTQPSAHRLQRLRRRDLGGQDHMLLERRDFLDLLAPLAGSTHPLGGQFSAFCGHPRPPRTRRGGGALLEREPSLTPDEIVTRLQATGKMMTTEIGRASRASSRRAILDLTRRRAEPRRRLPRDSRPRCRPTPTATGSATPATTAGHGEPEPETTPITTVSGPCDASPTPSPRDALRVDPGNAGVSTSSTEPPRRPELLPTPEPRSRRLGARVRGAPRDVFYTNGTRRERRRSTR